MLIRDFTDFVFLGRGGQACVQSAFCKTLNRRAAIKKLFCDDNVRSQIEKEIDILRQIRHANIVVILDAFNVQERSEIWIITEFINGGSLRPYCTGEKKGVLSTAEKLKVCMQCWSALDYLHANKITHKDIKPENILLQVVAVTQPVSHTAKLCDFGLAKVLETVNETRRTTLSGTDSYWPPEMMLGKTDDSRVRNPQQGDVYSLGVTCCELLTGMDFWCGPDGICLPEHKIICELTMIANDPSTPRPTLPCVKSLLQLHDVDKRTKGILKRTVLLNDRNERPSAAEVLNVLTKKEVSSVLSLFELVLTQCMIYSTFLAYMMFTAMILVVLPKLWYFLKDTYNTLVVEDGWIVLVFLFVCLFGIGCCVMAVVHLEAKVHNFIFGARR